MFKKFIAIIVIFFGVVGLSGCAPEVTNELPRVGIIIENATVSVGENEAIVSAQITNRANGTVTLTGAQASSGAETQLREGTEVLEAGIEIHVGQTVELKEKGKHFVLLKLTKPISFGDKVEFTFQFEGAEAQTIQLTAK